MPSETRQQVKYFTPLRQAQRDLTRSRIKNAARDLFYEHHYDATTMDEIALAAGLRRSTLYLHYKDKAEILADVIADYTPKAKDSLAGLPGPKPSLRQVEKWVKEVAQFVGKERIPLSIILEVRHNQAYADAMTDLTSQLLAGLGANNPPFREAASDGADPVKRARAVLLLMELTYACEGFLDEPSSPVGKALLAVAAEDFTTFLSQD